MKLVEHWAWLLIFLMAVYVSVRSFRRRYKNACAAVAVAVANSNAYLALKAELAAAATANATGGSVTIHVDSSGRVFTPAGELAVPGLERPDHLVVGGGGHFLHRADGGPDDRKALGGGPRELESVRNGVLLRDDLRDGGAVDSSGLGGEALDGPWDVPELVVRSSGGQRGDVVGARRAVDRSDLANPVRRRRVKDLGVPRGLAV